MFSREKTQSQSQAVLKALENWAVAVERANTSARKSETHPEAIACKDALDDLLKTLDHIHPTPTFRRFFAVLPFPR